jgi:hypothetical protein
MEGSNAWWPMKGSNAWWSLKEKHPFHLFSLSSLQILLKPFSFH